MTGDCQNTAEGLANGVAGALHAVDCVAGEATTLAFERLFGSGGALLSTLTVLLTLYVGFFALNLLTGRGGLGVRFLAPRMMTLGLVLTFATSWAAYSTVVWNLAIGAPDQIAGIVTGEAGSATRLFAEKIDVVFAALLQASPQGSGAQAQAAAPSAFSPEGMMWLGAMLFLLGTLGVLVTARIALAVLVMTGPVFVVLALFEGTRGLFAGWIKGLVLLALVPLFAVLGGTIMLELAVPVMTALLATPGQIDPQAAMAFFLVGAVHAALMVIVLKVLGTMVGGWTVFGLAAQRGAEGDDMARSPGAERVAASGAAPERAVGRGEAERRIPAAAFASPAAMSHAAPAAAASDQRSRITVQGLAPSLAIAPAPAASHSRTRGIGVRFRKPAARPLRSHATGTRP